MNLFDEIQELDRTRRWNPTFQMLHLETRQLIEDKTQKTARLPQNRVLNRYRDVLPYDDTRVKLKTKSNDYINACYVQVPDVSRRYILAQGPLPNTCEDFWRMIWENNTTAIIMLNRIVEKNMIKCHPYWPMGEDEVVEFGDFQIVLQSTQMEDAYIIREFLVTKLNTNEERKVKHFHFVMWPDFGVPQEPSWFLQYLDDIKKCGVLSNPDSPPVVHCSAGIGRSGTFCLVDTVLAMAERDETTDIDIRHILLTQRKCRCGLIQTAEQYRFANVSILNGFHSLFPTTFQDQTFVPSVLETNDDEPPPLPPRRTKNNVPPPKPAYPTSAQSVDTNQAKQYQKITSIESSDEDGDSEEEVINLSDEESYTEIIDPVEDSEDSTSAEITIPQKEDSEELHQHTIQENAEIARTKIEDSCEKLSEQEVKIGTKASENNELRHRLREKKKQETKDRVDEIKRRMKETEKKSPLTSYLPYIGVAVGAGICFLVYKWWV